MSDVVHLTSLFASKQWWNSVPDDEEAKETKKQKVSHCTATLYPHQEYAIDWLSKRPKGGILSLTMGLGKSLSVAYWALLREKASKVLLVVAKSLVPNWIVMLNKFFPELQYDVVHSDYSHNPMTYTNPDGKQWLITTYDVISSIGRKASIGTLYYSPELRCIQRTEEHRAKLSTSFHFFTETFDVVISDESQVFRNPEGLLYPSMMGLFSKKYVLLTGTPIQNHFDDLYTQLHFLGVDGVHSFTHFNSELFNHLEMKQHFLIMGYEEANITLPEEKRHTLMIDMDPLERRAYDFLIEQIKEEIKMGRKGAMLAMITRLRNACLSIGLAYRGKNAYKRQLSRVCPEAKDKFRNVESGFWQTSSKFRKAMQLIHHIVNSRHEKVIVFSSFLSALRHLGYSIEKHLGIKCISVEGSMPIHERTTNISTYVYSPLHPVMLLTFAIGAEGMNLTCANHIILLDYWWSPSTIKQAIARALRIGQTKTVYIYSLINNDTIESKVHQIVKDKSDVINAFEESAIVRELETTLYTDL